jgi:aspartate/methionine/tyrosine aminotransferase
MVQSFHERRDLIVKLLNEIEGVTCHSPGGAFYVFPNVTRALANLGMKDANELRKLLLQNGVAVLADIHFGNLNPGDPDQHLRLSYATSKQNIIDGLAIMKRVIEKKA